MQPARASFQHPERPLFPSCQYCWRACNPPLLRDSAHPAWQSPSPAPCPARPCHLPGAIASNLSKLHAAKRAFNRYKPNTVLYVDRLDAGRRDLADLSVSVLSFELCTQEGVLPGGQRASGAWGLGANTGRWVLHHSSLRTHAGALLFAELSTPSFPFLLSSPQVVRAITDVFGADMWFSTVLVLSHGSCAPPDTSSGQVGGGVLLASPA